VIVAKGGKPSPRRGSIIVISAPSGAGKSTLVNRLVASVPNLGFSVSHTTRPRRAGEKNGHDYFFVRRERFKRMIAGGEFVEWADVFGNLYGTSWQQLRAAEAAGKDLLLNIDVQGHRQLRRRLPEAVSVFLLPPSFPELERRLRHRHSDCPEAIRHRLEIAREEITHWPEYDYLVVNDRLLAATEALQAIVHSARYRRHNQENRAREICKTFGGKANGFASGY
jgi:guanylate kinase